MEASSGVDEAVFGGALLIESLDDLVSIEENSEWLGVTKLLMMENAATAVAEACKDILKDLRGKRIAIVCGKGNNGGDGIAAGRKMAAEGAQVTIFMLSKEPEAYEAKYNFDIVRRLPYSLEIKRVREEKDLDVLRTYDLIVDALLGTGTRGAPYGLTVGAIRKINSSGKPVVSVDVPSGLDPFSGRAPGEVVKATITVTFHGMKSGLRPEICGRIVVCPAGSPLEALLGCGPGDLKALIRKRAPWSHKGDFGRILVIGGSCLYTGAPALAAISALRSGADLAIVLTPRSVSNVIRSFSPEIIVNRLESEDFLGEEEEDLDLVLREAERSSVVLIGPGLGSEKCAIEMASRILEELKGRSIKVVVDADAQRALSPGKGWRDLIATPHAGEFERIFGVIPPKDLKKRIDVAAKNAAKLPGTVLLKGHVDVISDGRRVKINFTGNPGMTVGGTGDVLSGVTAAMFSLGNDPLRAASCAAWIVGSAGDLAYEKVGNSLTPLDVIRNIPEVIRRYAP